jgi:sulfur-carrier protein adenylyltransferase/sulfurtransferase
MKSISVKELKERLDQGEEIQLIDVREPFEYQICKLEAELIPMNTIPMNLERIHTQNPVVVFCHHGMRSAMVIDYLEKNAGHTNLYNLEGGIHAWAKEVDNEMAVY